MIEGKAGVGAATDSTGVFLIPKVAPGICCLIVSCLGYKGTVSSENEVFETRKRNLDSHAGDYGGVLTVGFILLTVRTLFSQAERTDDE